MKKYFVLFCLKNMQRPNIYLTRKSINDKMKGNTSLAYKVFDKQLDAQKFIYPKKISYLILKQELQQRGVDIETMQMIKTKEKQNAKKSKIISQYLQKNLKKQNQQTEIDQNTHFQGHSVQKIDQTAEQDNLSIDEPRVQQQNAQVELQSTESKEIKKGISKKQTKNKQSTHNLHKQQTSHEQKQEKTGVNHKQNIKKQQQQNQTIKQVSQIQIKKEQSTKKEQKSISKQKERAESTVNQSQGLEGEGVESSLNIAQLQKQMREVALTSIMKTNLFKTYEQILAYQGDTKKYIRSFPLTQIKSHHTYFAFFDGCSKGNPGASGCGYVVLSGTSIIYQKSLNLGFRTNNQSQFLALIYCLLDCKHNDISKLKVMGDSELVVKALNDEVKIKDKKLKYLYIVAKYLSKSFDQFQIVHVARKSNTKADALANAGIKKKCLSSRTFTYLDD